MITTLPVRQPTSSQTAIPLIDRTTTMAPPTLYHILLTTHNSPARYNPHNPLLSTLRSPGTYTSYPHALAAAHKALFDLGFERDFFSTYDVSHPTPPSAGSAPAATAATPVVHATARDGSVFRVYIAATATPSEQAQQAGGAWEAGYEDGRVGGDVFLAVRTRVRLEDEEEEGEGVREHVVLNAGRGWGEMVRWVRGWWKEEEKEKAKWEAVDVLGEEESELGENVVVHAVGKAGENVIVSVVKVVELEAVRVGEASMRIR